MSSMPPMSRFSLEFRPLRALRLPVILLALGASLAFANHHEKGHGGHGKGIDRMVAKMEKELKLSKDQSARIRAILSRDSADMPDHALGAPPEGGRWGGPHGGGAGMGGMGGSEFAKQLRADRVDTGALNKRFEERQSRMREMHARHLAKFVAIHDVLTPEQRAKAAEEMEKRLGKTKKK